MVAEQVAAAAAAAKANAKAPVKQRGVSGSPLRAPADEVVPAKVRAAGLGHRARPTHPTHRRSDSMHRSRRVALQGRQEG